jgi:hypothetical protein
VLNEKFGNINIDDKNKDKVRDKYINNFPIITTRGFGDLQYKYNNIINFEGQYISNKPDIIEIPLDELNFLIIGNNGCFNEKEKTISLEKYFLDNYIKNKEQKLSNIIEEFFKELEKNKEMNINLASIIIEFKHENNLNNLNNILLEEDKKETPDKNDNIKNKSDEEEENL